MKACVFCAIAQGRRSARIVLETDDAVCFFPLHVELLGHTLIASKHHYQHIVDCVSEFGSSVLVACQLLHAHYAGAIGSSGFNLLSASGRVAGQSVDHLHFHFMPRVEGDGLNTWPRLPAFKTDLDALHERLTVPLATFRC